MGMEHLKKIHKQRVFAIMWLSECVVKQSKANIHGNSEDKHRGFGYMIGDGDLSGISLLLVVTAGERLWEKMSPRKGVVQFEIKEDDGRSIIYWLAKGLENVTDSKTPTFSTRVD